MSEQWYIYASLFHVVKPRRQEFVDLTESVQATQRRDYGLRRNAEPIGVHKRTFYLNKNGTLRKHKMINILRIRSSRNHNSSQIGRRALLLCWRHTLERAQLLLTVDGMLSGTYGKWPSSPPMVCSGLQWETNYKRLHRNIWKHRQKTEDKIPKIGKRSDCARRGITPHTCMYNHMYVIFCDVKRVRKAFIEQPGKGYRHSTERGTFRNCSAYPLKIFFPSISPAGPLTPQCITSREANRIAACFMGATAHLLSRSNCLELL